MLCFFLGFLLPPHGILAPWSQERLLCALMQSSPWTEHTVHIGTQSSVSDNMKPSVLFSIYADSHRFWSVFFFCFISGRAYWLEVPIQSQTSWTGMSALLRADSGLQGKFCKPSVFSFLTYKREMIIVFLAAGTCCCKDEIDSICKFFSCIENGSKKQTKQTRTDSEMDT